jgi:hypothetical protein
MPGGEERPAALRLNHENTRKQHSIPPPKKDRRHSHRGPDVILGPRQRLDPRRAGRVASFGKAAR